MNKCLKFGGYQSYKVRKMTKIKGVIDSSLLIPVERYCLILLALLFQEELLCSSPTYLEERSRTLK